MCGLKATAYNSPKCIPMEKLIGNDLGTPVLAIMLLK